MNRKQLVFRTSLTDATGADIEGCNKRGQAMEWMFLPLKRYADFDGRSRRMEYWMFALGRYLFYLFIGILWKIVGPFALTIGGLGIVALILPSLAVQVRRFHDQDKNGGFPLLNCIPYIGQIIVFVFMCLDGTPGSNRFGQDPKDPNAFDYI